MICAYWALSHICARMKKILPVVVLILSPINSTVSETL